MKYANAKNVDEGKCKSMSLMENEKTLYKMSKYIEIDKKIEIEINNKSLIKNKVFKT